MGQIVKSMDIEAQPMIIWTILVKHLEHPQYSERAASGAVQIRGIGGVPLTDERKGVGVRTRWTYEFKGRHYTWDDEVTAWEEGRRIAWKAISAWIMTDSFELIPLEAKTRVVYRMKYKFPYGPIGRLLARLVYHRHIDRSIEETLNGLRSSAEKIALLKAGHT